MPQPPVYSRFEAAWVPFAPDRSRQAASDLAWQWAARRAAARGRPVISIGGGRSANSGPVFGRRAGGRGLAPDASLRNGPGAVVLCNPTFDLLGWAGQLSAGNALAVVGDHGPNRLTGWAGAVGAVNLDTGERSRLDASLRDCLTRLAGYDVNGHTSEPGYAHRLLADMAAAGRLERAVVLGALVGFGVSAKGLAAVAELIDLILPVATWLATPSD